MACVWGSGWPSRTWWYTTLCVFAAYWTLQGEHGVGPSLVDQVAGAQSGQVYLGDLCLWLQVDLQPYLYGGAAWWPPPGWALLRGHRWARLTGWPVAMVAGGPVELGGLQPYFVVKQSGVTCQGWTRMQGYR